MLSIANQSGQVKEGGELSRKGRASRIWVFTGLGAIILAVLYLLAGCGSESTPGQSAKGKTIPPAAKSGATRGQTPSPLLIREAGSGPENLGPVKKQPDSKLAEMLPGLSREELAAKMAEERKKLDASDTEVVPGLTKKEVEAKKAAGKAMTPEIKKELFFGMTEEELNDKMAKGRERYYAPGNEVLPGLTMEEYQARQAAAAAHRPDQRTMMETFPGKSVSKK